ncbi:MAG TPA: hypothetical protein VFY16_02700 [Gemmatimonadaceae bacterium]|nr:hypothetical protein [Gemmatimonadaceae bacterium]
MRVAQLNRRATLALALLATAACARNPEPGATGEQDESPLVENVSLVVDNEFKTDVVVYVTTGGAPQRIGQVTSFTTATFTLGSMQLGTGNGVRFLVRAIGSPETWSSDGLVVRDGQLVQLSLATQLERSAYAVY